jgi:hypothetical protein
MPSPLWTDVTSASSIERQLLGRNKLHLEQTAREGGISTTKPFVALRENGGFNSFSSKVLEGETITEYDLSPDALAFFRALRRTDEDRLLPPVLGVITSSDFQEMFCRARERTSSDSRTSNYTIWKCLAKDDKISGFASVLLSLPFVYGFVNPFWTHMTDLMLEKKPGVAQIHTLRIIGKVSAEFNTCLKFLIGHKASKNFEASSPCDEQHGFRPNRSSVDAMMLKLLTFESARMQRCTIGSLQHDMTAHFDRMYLEMTSIYATKYAVNENIMKSVGSTIERLRRNVETSLGLSQESYGQEADAPRLGGMVQGKADVPQFSTQQSDAMLKAHKSRTYGVNIVSPMLSRCIRHHSIAFADDTDGQVSEDTTLELSVPRVVRRLQHSGQTWSNITNICGGLIAWHKCIWQLMAWEYPRGHVELRTTTDETLTLYDEKGVPSTIAYCPPHEPNVGLGFHLCPDGSQLAHFNATLAAIRKLCLSAASAHLLESEARQFVTQRLAPKLSYALHGTSFSRKQCSRINSTIRNAIVPLLRLNQHYPGVILHGPTKFGGMEFVDTQCLQDQVQLDYLVKQLRWDNSVANYLLVALDSVQMVAGFMQPLLEYTNLPLVYAGNSYLLDIRSRLAALDASLWVEKAWSPPLQREGDESLMERFVQIPNITRAELRRANAVRLYLRVVTIADLADVGGSYIPAGMLNGDWQAGSDLKWPFQPMPPKPFWRTFRHCLQRTFCTRAA